MTIDRSLASVRELALEAEKSAVNDRGYNNPRSSALVPTVRQVDRC